MLTWFYYSGRVPVPVTLADGRVASIQPRSHVKTRAQYVQKYGTKFNRCGPPDNAEELELVFDPKTPTSLEAVAFKGGPKAMKDSIRELTGPEAVAVRTVDASVAASAEAGSKPEPEKAKDEKKTPRRRTKPS